MINYEFFQEIAQYANDNWANGSFTKEEVNEYAKTYHQDFKWSKENDEIADSIKTLCENLAEDIREMDDIRIRQYLYEIASELGLIDMDYADYLETDEWLGEFL